jgi:hypothetical protein
MVSPDSDYDNVFGMYWINKNIRTIDFSKWEIFLESKEWETTKINMSGDSILNQYYDFFNGENMLPSNSVYDCKLEIKETIKQFKNQPIRKLTVEEEKNCTDKSMRALGRAQSFTQRRKSHRQYSSLKSQMAL